MRREGVNYNYAIANTKSIKSFFIFQMSFYFLKINEQNKIKKKKNLIYYTK